jgi:hypothetical protein
MPLQYIARIDMTLRLFDGDISLTELMNMDIPSQRALVQSRIKKLNESMENLENGRVDAYSRRYAGTMGGGFGGGSSSGISYHAPSSSQTGDNQNDKIDRSKSRNYKDAAR